MLKLYYTPKTSAFRCRWLLEELGEPFDLVRVDFARREHKTPEYLKVHPLGSVPALQDGEQVILESAAILMYLADRGPGLRFAPALNSPERGAYYQWIMFGMTNLNEAIHGPYLRYYMRGETASAAEREALARLLALSDERLTSGPYLLGAQFTAADVVLGALLVWAEACGLLLGREPQSSYLERLRERPAFVRASQD
ncbi:MAG: glutathione S-transferase family protein [Myxococcales bacterium]|nr:glutathione S-transferase family protein [Myxococcales bacterium]